MDEEIRHLVAEMDLNPPATKEALAQLSQEFGVVLPPDYAAFMLEANGGVGFVGASYLILFRLEDIGSRNRDFPVAEYAPDLVLFGNAGDDTAFAFDENSQPATFVDVPMIGMSPEETTPRGRTFAEFLRALHAGLDW